MKARDQYKYACSVRLLSCNIRTRSRNWSSSLTARNGGKLTGALGRKTARGTARRRDGRQHGSFRLAVPQTGQASL